MRNNSFYRYFHCFDALCTEQAQFDAFAGIKEDSGIFYSGEMCAYLPGWNSINFNQIFTGFTLLFIGGVKKGKRGELCSALRFRFSIPIYLIYNSFEKF